MKNRYDKTLVIDTSYIARSIITTERAFVISYKGNADVVTEYPETFGVVNPELTILKPSIIKVHTYVKMNFYKVPLTRENIFKRDGYVCVYCGNDKRKNLTIDHVVPQSKGGPNTWDNLVSACKRCNNQKASLTLEEYGKPIPKPQRPHYLMLLKKTLFIPDEWKPYLLM
tara:strand:+ start:2510 stop:3019 length:510 start_codon:yes stop_codon:yes gene_type:complete